MEFEIEGNAALVAASSSGLGKASAMALAREGADVMLNGRSDEKLDRAVADVEEVATGDVHAYQADLTDSNDIEQLVNHSVETFDGLDHLVTNAGGPPSGSFLETTDEEWYDAFDLLVMSAVRLIRAASDPLRADGGGTIVNITSRSVKEAIDSLVLSNSVRMSVIGLEKTLSRELAPSVRVNAVLPGPHETARTRELIEQGVERGDYEDYDEGLERRSESIPVGELGNPATFGKVVAFLSSPASGHVNGTAVPIDGGMGNSNL